MDEIMQIFSRNTSLQLPRLPLFAFWFLLTFAPVPRNSKLFPRLTKN